MMDGAQHGKANLALGGCDDSAHQKACSVTGECARCKWAQHKDRWQEELPWLDAKINLENQTWGIGCKLCSEAQRLSPETMAKFPVSRHHFARYDVSTGDIRVGRFRKHAASPAHRTAESLASGRVALADIEGFCPTQAEWVSVLSHSKPNDCPADLTDVGNRKKVHMMRWCLSEAIRQSQRSFIEDALCLSLQQDARGRRFLVRFRAVDSNLKVCAGTLQLTKVQYSPDTPGAQNIRKMTLLALESFCTPLAAPAYGGRVASTKVECDYSLLKRLTERVECIAADAAADEQLALRDMAAISGPSVTPLEDVMSQAFPNLKAPGLVEQVSIFRTFGFISDSYHPEVLGKDRAHAAQRMLSRPWAADGVLKEVIGHFVEKPHSIARLISNSESVKDLYVNFRKKSDELVPISKNIRDLAFAPQRYSSESKVLARLVLTWDAVLGVLTSLPEIRGRTSTEGNACLETLAFLTPEKALLLAMLADAALELHRVVRAFDAEVCDESELPYELDRYRSVIRKLFIEGACLHVGLTKMMLKHLEQPRLLLSAGFRSTFGGPGAVTQDVTSDCLKRMSAYVVVAESVLEGEFPSFQLVSSLRVFSLSDSSRNQKQLESGERSNCLEKIAQAIGIDAESLKYEFQHFHPIAAKFAQVENLENFAAWREAITRTSKNRMAHSADSLIPALARLGCWSCSSSSVERGLGAAQNLKQLGQSQDENISGEEVLLILQQDAGQISHDNKSLIASAKELWAKTCSRVRTSGQGKRVQRWDKDIPRRASCILVS